MTSETVAQDIVRIQRRIAPRLGLWERAKWKEECVKPVSDISKLYCAAAVGGALPCKVCQRDLREHRRY